MRVMRKMVPWILVCLVLPVVANAAEPRKVELLETMDLAQDAAKARKKNVPILIMFTTQECPYCRLVEGSFLRPMLISGDYDNKVLMRKIRIDDYSSILDFDGSQQDIDKIRYRYNVSMVPTVVLVDHNGNMLSRLVGIANEYFYGGELDAAIDQSLQSVRKLVYQK